jgi:hypothetical protein
VEKVMNVRVASKAGPGSLDAHIWTVNEALDVLDAPSGKTVKMQDDIDLKVGTTEAQKAYAAHILTAKVFELSALRHLSPMDDRRRVNKLALIAMRLLNLPEGVREKLFNEKRMRLAIMMAAGHVFLRSRNLADIKNLAEDMAAKPWIAEDKNIRRIKWVLVNAHSAVRPHYAKTGLKNLLKAAKTHAPEKRVKIDAVLDTQRGKFTRTILRTFRSRNPTAFGPAKKAATGSPRWLASRLYRVVMIPSRMFPIQRSPRLPAADQPRRQNMALHQ